MAGPWPFLCRDLASRERECRAWCRQAGLDYSPPAQLAFLLTSVPEGKWWLRDPWSTDADFLFPLLARTSPEWLQFSEWAHPQFGLNLLQLAIIFDNPSAVRFLCQSPLLLRDDRYRDASSKLVNHPLHLAFCLRGSPYHTLEDVFDQLPESLFEEECTIDLTADTLRASSSFHKSPVKPLSHDTSLQAASSAGGDKVLFDKHESPLLELVLQTGDIFLQTTAPFQHPVKMTFLSESELIDLDKAEFLLRWVYRKLIKGQAQSSTVETLWKTTKHLCANGMSECFFNIMCLTLFLDYALPRELLEDTLLLACQLVWAVPEEARGEDCHQAVSRFFHRAVESRVPHLPAARCLPRPVLQYLIDHTHEWSGNDSDLDLFDRAVQSLQDLLREPSVQGDCIRTVLKQVKGDPNKVHSLGDCPWPLLESFPIPFQKLHGVLLKKEKKRTPSDCQGSPRLRQNAP